MKVMVLVKASVESEAGIMPSKSLLTAMGEFNAELVRAGVMLAGEGLHPSFRGKRVQFSGKDRVVLDGPFTETKELVAGFWLWQVKSLDEAVEWVRRCPNPHPGSADPVIEIRPLFEAADFGVELSPELRAQEDRQRNQMQSSTDR
ncbi:MAG TPA: YciI family protein [Steroidobacteraceae bacterium]